MGCSTCGKKSPFLTGMVSQVPPQQAVVTYPVPPGVPQAVRGVIKYVSPVPPETPPTPEPDKSKA